MKKQISLKWMLIVLGVLGTVVGLLGRLWMRNPERCLLIVRYAMMISYLVCTLIALFFQRRQAAQKQKQTSFWLLTSIGWVVLMLGACLPDSSRAVPTKYLVKEKLFVHRDGRLGSHTAVWNELERRFFDDRLSKADAQLIFAEYQGRLKKRTTRSGIHSAPTTQLLRRMASRGMVSDEQLVSLGEAFYGEPTSPPLRLRTTEDRIRITFNEFGRYFGDSHPTTLIWYATSVQVDGNDVPFRHGRYGRAASITEPIEEGKHEIRVELDCALVMYDAIKNQNVPSPEPRQSYPISQWPDKLLKRWKKVVVISATVHDPKEELIAFTSNTDLNPKPFVSFDEIEVWVTGNGKPRWRLRNSVDENLPIAMSGNLFVRIDNNEFQTKPLVTESKPRVTPGWSAPIDCDLDPANVKAKTATVEFTPNRKYLERETDVTEIWGRRIIFKGVPIKIRK